MRLRIVFQGSVPKDDGPDATNEDSIAVDEARQRFALSDGASESYHSGLWSKLLSEAWVAGGHHVSRTGLESVIRRYEEACDPESLSWSKRGAFDRGSFATLLGIEVRGDALRVTAFGDSIVVASPIDESFRSFPYTTVDEFERRPLLLATVRVANVEVLQRRASRSKIVRWPLAPGIALLAMTDALGQWLFRQNANDSSRSALEQIRTVAQLSALVDSERAAGRMRRDDTTLLHLQPEVV